MKSIKLNQTAVKEIEKSIFFFKQAKEVLISDIKTKELKSLPATHLKRWIRNTFKIFTHEIKTTEKERKAQLSKENETLENLVLDLMIKNQYSRLVFTRNPFTDTPVIKRDDHQLHYTAPHFYIKEYEDKYNIQQIEKNIIIEDYKKHFPQFEEFLNWLIACRFTTNRRTSYTYIRFSAGFGKSLLAGIFSELGVGRKINQHQLKANSAGDLSPMDFRNAFILMIDEFTHFQQELKDMTHGMHLSAKYALSEYVPLYAKVFLSAEKSTSFFGDAGVDAQLADRVNVIDLSDAGKIDKNKLYKKNTLAYTSVLTEYVYSYFKDKADYYVSIGELAANKVANDILDNYHNKYKMEADTVERIREKCVDYIRDYILWLEESDSFGNKPRNTFFEKLDKLIYLKNENEIVVKELTKLYETLIDEAGEQFKKTAKFKQTMLDEIFEINLTKKVYKISDKSIRGFLINLSKLDKKHIEVVHEIIDKEGNLVDKDGNKLF